ncbi:hypothetical protein I79_021190 [Cricetulus griseus]|uniref:Uncharacterized protein n=1 Tax=Cricetulus griseus TaxID=10029 RepID=G3IC03_CRIGR|nr:hypothetical protein I79_021190 [Cricetulus griseus]
MGGLPIAPALPSAAGPFGPSSQRCLPRPDSVSLPWYPAVASPYTLVTSSDSPLSCRRSVAVPTVCIPPVL